MSTPTLVGFGASDFIAADRMLRVTFGEKLSLNPDALFAHYWPSVMERLSPVARFIPIAPTPVISGATVAVVSGNNKLARTGAELVTALQAASSGNFVEVRKVELLPPAVAKAETGTAGAKARDQEATKATELADANSITRKIAESFGVTAKVATVIAVAIILVIVWYFIPKRSS